MEVKKNKKLEELTQSEILLYAKRIKELRRVILIMIFMFTTTNSYS